MTPEEITTEVERIADYLGCNKAELLHEMLGLIEKIIKNK